MSLEEYGWNDSLAKQFEPLAERGYGMGRVRIAYQDRFLLAMADGEQEIAPSGKLLQQARRGEMTMPVVGDWVLLRDGDGLVDGYLPRRTELARKSAGQRTERQVIAANVDVVFLVVALDRDFNVGRIERYLLLARVSGTRPVIVLNKSDLLPEADLHIQQVVDVAEGSPVHLASALEGEGVGAIFGEIGEGETGVFLGSSGVGKSTLVNRLLGEDVQEVAAIGSGTQRGRHTTTHRTLFRHPQGCLIIDSPGMREFQPWVSAAQIERAFPEIAAKADECKFGDCTHEHEPACAVLTAVSEGGITGRRLTNYQRLRAELSALDTKREQMPQPGRGTGRRPRRR